MVSLHIAKIIYMIEILGAIDNREWSLLTWILMLVLSLILNTPTRKPVLRLLALMVTGYFVTVILLFIAYTMAMILVLQKAGFWELSLAKDSIIWLFSFAIFSIFKFEEKRKGYLDYLKSVLVSSLKLTVFIQFVANFYVMSLIAELVFIPIATIIICLVLFSEHLQEKDAKYEAATKLFNFFLVLILGIVLFKASLSFISSPMELLSLYSLKRVALPIILTILFIPVMYIVDLYLFYEILSVRLNTLFWKNKKLFRYARWRVLFLCGASIDKVFLADEKLRGRVIHSKDELLQALSKERSQVNEHGSQDGQDFTFQNQC